MRVFYDVEIGPPGTVQRPRHRPQKGATGRATGKRGSRMDETIARKFDEMGARVRIRPLEPRDSWRSRDVLPGWPDFWTDAWRRRAGDQSSGGWQPHLTQSARA
jgi:hypothetical protein